MVAVFEARDARKSFVVGRSIFGRPQERVVAVDGVSFTVEPSETVALVGESGSGKTTVGRLALRLLEVDSGSVSLQGQVLADCSPRQMAKLRAKGRMIFQDPFSSLDPRMLVGQSVMQPLILHTDLDREQRRAEALALFERVGLNSSHFDRYPHEFSGGQLQRVAIARAIATKPKFVVCDEPTAALDMSIRAQVINLLHDLQTESGLAYLFISHDLSLVRLIASRVLVMYRGQIIESGPVAQIFEQPEHPYTRRLLAAIPRLDGSRRHARSSIRHSVEDEVVAPTRIDLDEEAGVAKPAEL